MGGLDKAKEYILKAMKNGKHVVTANKALLAEFGDDIYQAAEEYGVSLAFEASVGGGIPIIGSFKGGLSANRIQNMMGILNGTSNYILTRMTDKGLPYQEAVEEAIGLGYAEDPPTLDVDGTDAAHKLAILISIALGIPVTFDSIYREGIDKLTPEDIRFAGEFGYCIKLLAISKRRQNAVEARVHPTMIPRNNILSSVSGTLNAITISGHAVDNLFLSGHGAGMMPTASAVVSDVVDLARNLPYKAAGRIPVMGYMKECIAPIPVMPVTEIETCYYFRFSTLDKPGVLSTVSGVLGDNGISIQSVHQKGRKTNGAVPIVMLTHRAVEADVRNAIKKIETLDVVTGQPVLIRIEDENHMD
jgi:homoserine dehydrogenase